MLNGLKGIPAVTLLGLVITDKCGQWISFIVKKPAIINGARKQLYMSRLVLKEAPEKDIVCSVI